MIMKISGDDKTVEVIDDQGNIIKCDILFTFESPETGKNYIVYTDYSKLDDGSINTYASVYNPDDEDTKLYPVETEDEWKVIDTILLTLQEEIRKRREKKEDN